VTAVTAAAARASMATARGMATDTDTVTAAIPIHTLTLTLTRTCAPRSPLSSRWTTPARADARFAALKPPRLRLRLLTNVYCAVTRSTCTQLWTVSTQRISARPVSSA
jgi:hypothetical protein